MGGNLRVGGRLWICRHVPSELHQSGSALASGGGKVGRGSWFIPKSVLGPGPSSAPGAAGTPWLCSRRVSPEFIIGN